MLKCDTKRQTFFRQIQFLRLKVRKMREFQKEVARGWSRFYAKDLSILSSAEKGKDRENSIIRIFELFDEIKEFWIYDEIQVYVILCETAEGDVQRRILKFEILTFKLAQAGFPRRYLKAEISGNKMLPWTSYILCRDKLGFVIFSNQFDPSILLSAFVNKCILSKINILQKQNISETLS